MIFRLPSKPSQILSAQGGGRVVSLTYDASPLRIVFRNGGDQLPHTEIRGLPTTNSHDYADARPAANEADPR